MSEEPGPVEKEIGKLLYEQGRRMPEFWDARIEDRDLTPEEQVVILARSVKLHNEALIRLAKEVDQLRSSR